jgi:DNA-binding NarL/FixJ family response regulator
MICRFQHVGLGWVYEKTLKSKILIVEDYSIVVRDIKERLEHMDYNVLDIVSNGEDAIRKSNETKPDVVLMDVVLKGDLDGIKTAQKIQAHNNVPIIYITAYYDNKTLKRAATTLPSGFILKPSDDVGLDTSIQLALYKQQHIEELKSNSN